MHDINDIIDPDPNNIWTGEGNINLDPLFDDPKRHDYHLQTEYPQGRWDDTESTWLGSDPNTSPCINAGDPNSDYSMELPPNGGRINMGAFGNTWQASKSDYIPPSPAEIAGPAGVNFIDFAVFADSWLLEGVNIKNKKTDLNHDGIVNYKDLAIFCKYWLW